jgi:hypothetical protein
MTSTVKPAKINSVLARFEQTIQENNNAGGNSGMYLTNLAGRKAGGAAERRRMSIVASAGALVDGPGVGGAAQRRRMSMASNGGSLHGGIPTGRSGGRTSGGPSASRPDSFRGLALPEKNNTGHSAAGTVTTSTSAASLDWDPFSSEHPSSSAHSARSSTHSRATSRKAPLDDSFGNDSGNSFGIEEEVGFDEPFDPFAEEWEEEEEDDHEVDEEESERASRKLRKDRKSAGRIAARRTRTKATEPISSNRRKVRQEVPIKEEPDEDAESTSEAGVDTKKEKPKGSHKEFSERRRKLKAEAEGAEQDEDDGFIVTYSAHGNDDESQASGRRSVKSTRTSTRSMDSSSSHRSTVPRSSNKKSSASVSSSSRDATRSKSRREGRTSSSRTSDE